MTRVSIRVRLTAWYSVVLTLGLALFGLGMWFALQQRLIAGVDLRLKQKLQGMETALGAEGEIRSREQVQQELSEFAGEIADGSLIELRDDAGALVFPAPGHAPLLRGAANTHGEPFTLEHSGKPYRMITGMVGSAGTRYEARMAMPLDEVVDVMRDFRHLLFLMIPAVMGLACLGGYWLSLRALQPVDEITTAARSISVQNLSQRVLVPRTGDELQRMSETWNEVLERLDGSVKRIRQFTADASHELRTPLALIRTTAELALRRERNSEEYREALRNIENEAERMTVLTESLLSMARADSGSFDIPLGRIDLNPVAASVVQVSGALAIDKGIRLQAQIGPEPSLATANESGVRRLLTILVDNALKYTPAGGSVTVSVESACDGATISVCDTGKGISSEALPHIFDRFYRADPARAGGAGFGLGLSIAQVIAQAHGSRILAESAPGEGSRFSVALKR
jgi:heavy metal sensor kinase